MSGIIDVEQNEIAFGAFADGQGFLPAHRGDDVEILGRQPRFQQLDVGGDVVDDENAGGHCAWSLGLPRKWRIVSMNFPTEIGFDR